MEKGETAAVIKTAEEILYDHATKADDGFMTGQVKWIVEAMLEFAKQEKDIAYDMGYRDGTHDESIRIGWFLTDENKSRKSF